MSVKFSFKRKEEKRIKTKFGVVTYSQLSEILGLSVKSVQRWIYRYGIDDGIDRAESRVRRVKLEFLYDGEMRSVKEVENITGLSYARIAKAINDSEGGDIKPSLDDIISNGKNIKSVSGLNRECRRLSRIGNVETGIEFARCTGRSN